MLIQFLRGFVNFTGVNSRFLSPSPICKLPIRVKNQGFSPLPRRLESQTKRRFQTKIKGWQNTNFGFLSAQLDFLAIFSSNLED